MRTEDAKEESEIGTDLCIDIWGKPVSESWIDPCNDTWGVLFGVGGTWIEPRGELGTEVRANSCDDTSGVLLGVGGVGGTDSLRKPGIKGWMDSCTDPRGVLLGVGGCTETQELTVSRLESGPAP